jgi:D-alanyl-D-alanine carboxypeptidase/D-alanyl-D-alanine-endopeptidase (penicillin-binding protein 4)
MAVIVLCLLVAAPQVYELAPDAMNAYLAELHARQPDFAARLCEIAKRTLGTPYFDGPLGEGPGVKYDPDPLMDLSRVDCVTFVEQSIALAAASSYQQAFDLLQTIRYRNGHVAFEDRNHFMIADWIPNNPFCHDVSKELKIATATVKRTVGRKKFFDLKKAPELVRGASDPTIELTYVPSNEAAKAQAHLPSLALILLVGKADWLFVVHCGLFIRDESGNGLLYHASSIEGKVISIPFTEPFEKTTRYLGFTAYTIDDPATVKKP